MMKKNAKTLAILLAASMTVTGTWTPAMAAEMGPVLEENMEVYLDGEADRYITLDQTELTLALNETCTLQANTTPEDLFVSYESSDPAVATVDAGTGMITAVAEGTATITAYLDIDPTVTATCTVTVEGLTPISCGDDIFYTLSSDGVLTISGDGTMTDYYNDWFAPDPGWAASRENIKKIVVEEGVTEIKGAAFGFMWTYPNVKEIEIASTVTAIGDYAFGGCSGLESISLAGNAPEAPSTALPGSDITVYCSQDATGLEVDGAWTKTNVTITRIANEEPVYETVTVLADAQAEGAYLLSPQEYTVAANKAESYGYTDNVEDKVSTLDVLVALTEVMFGDDFTAETASDYLAVSESGWITTIFGEETGACSFRVNTEAVMTMINATELSDGDVLTYYLYTDRAYYTDAYTFLSVDGIVYEGESFVVTAVYEGYDSEWNTILLLLEEAALGILDETGMVTEIEGAVTDEDGKAELTFDQAGTYTIVAYGTDGSDRTLIMNPFTIVVEKVVSEDQKAADEVAELIQNLSTREDIEAARAAYEELTEEQKALVPAEVLWQLTDAEKELEREIKEEIAVNVTVDAQAEGAYLLAPQEYSVNAYKAESYGYTDNVEDNVSTLDVLVALTEVIFGDDFTSETASDYLAVSESGWITTIFGEETGACSFRINTKTPMTMINQTVVFGGDVLTFYLYTDRTYYTDVYTFLSVEDTVYEGESFVVTAEYEEYVSDSFTILLPLEEAALGILDETGTVTEIEGAVTDEDGKAELTFEEAGTYKIVAYGTDVSDRTLIMNPLTIDVEEVPADQKAAGAVVKLIQNLSTREDIQAARAAYEALTEEQKALVPAEVLEQLESAEKKQEEEDKKAEEEKQANQQKADEAVALIDAIGKLTADKKAAVEKASAAYEALNDAQKDLVPAEKKAVLDTAMKAMVDLGKTTVSFAKTKYTYTGKKLTPVAIVTYGTKTLVQGTDYTVSYTSNLNVGTAKATITLKGKYAGITSRTFQIVRANQKITVKVASKTYKQSKLMKKAYSFTIGAKAKGSAKITYKSSSKKVKVSKTGKVTVAKKTPKGTYKVTVRTAATKNYKAGKKIIKITVK